MKAWATIYNFFAAMLLMYMVLVLHKDIRINEKQFEEMRLRYVIDYATEGAFMSSLEGGNLGISYQDLQNIKINPENTLSTFKSIIALSYDMSLSTENMNALDNYISSAVIAVSDGYYIASLREVDTDKLQGRGGEYALKWGLKKPYVIQHNPTKLVAYNISNEQWITTQPNGSGGITVLSGDTFNELSISHGISTTRERILSEINKRITEDINYTIEQRNATYKKNETKDFVYLPSVKTKSGVNTIKKPSIFITLSGVDFAGTQKLEAQSVGGFTIAKKRRVLGFIQGGIQYYCYESQIPTANLGTVLKFFNTVEEAALAGYKPHVDYLRKPIPE